MMLWATLEISLGIIAACLSTCRPMFASVLGALTLRQCSHTMTTVCTPDARSGKVHSTGNFPAASSESMAILMHGEKASDIVLVDSHASQAEGGVERYSRESVQVQSAQ